jgi:phosphatidylinositol alpha 1,6-mannosyltransferase
VITDPHRPISAAPQPVQAPRPGGEDRLARVKRVAIFAEAFLPKIDGVAKSALMTLRHLQATGRDALVFAPDSAPPFVGPSQVLRLPSIGIPFYPESRVAPPSPYVMAHLNDFKPDLVHCFNPVLMSWSAVWANPTLRVPLVANYQTDLPGYTADYGLNLLEDFSRSLLRRLHNSSHLTLVPSTHTLHQLEQWGFRRLRLWGRGVDSNRFTPEKRSRAWRERLLAGRDADRLLCVYIGRLAAEKHVEDLHGVAKLPGVALTIVGDGAWREKLEQHFADTDAVFTGYLTGDDLASAYASADVFAFTGSRETFGQVVLEAAASGLPLVAPSSGGVVDMVIPGETGILCDSKDTDDYARAVARLRDDPTLRARLASGALRLGRSRPWSAIMRQLEEYYQEALDINQRLLAEPSLHLNDLDM